MPTETPQTPNTDVNAGQPAAPATPDNGGQPAQPAPAPTNPQQGTGEQPGIRNNPQGGEQQPAEPVNYQEKFSQSTRENQRLMEILRTRGIDPETGSPVQGAPAVQPAQPTEPTQPNNFAGYTDEQLANAIPGFNALSADEKQVIRDAKNTAKTVAELQRQLAVVLDERETNKQIGELKKNDAFKAIAENEAAFREFIYRPENLELNIEHLAYKFMSELAAGTITPTQPEAPAQPTQPGMEGNTGGGKQVNDATANGVREMTAAEAAELRKSDHRTYNELARTGKLKIVTRQ